MSLLSVKRTTLRLVLFVGVAIAGAGSGQNIAKSDPFPPVDQKRPPLVIEHHGIFWAGGTIRTRTQQGTETSGSMQVPIAGNLRSPRIKPHVEYYIPYKLRKVRKSLP